MRGRFEFGTFCFSFVCYPENPVEILKSLKKQMIIKGPYPDVSIPKTALTPFVLHRARTRRQACADRRSNRPGRHVPATRGCDQYRGPQSVARGFKKGEVFGILSPNCPEYGIAFHAIATFGGIVTPINPLYTRYEIAHQLKNSGARFLVTVPGCLTRSAKPHKTPASKNFLFSDRADGATPFDTLMVDNGRAEQVEIDPFKDLIALPYSSGTTGLPKGVMLTHHNLVANICQMEGLCYFYETDTLICVLPLFHIYGLVVVLNMGFTAAQRSC